MGIHKQYFKSLRILTRKSNIKQDGIKRLTDEKKHKSEIEKLQKEIKDLEQQIKDWFKQDTPKYLEKLKKKVP